MYVATRTKGVFRWPNSRPNWFPNQRQWAQSLALDLILWPESDLGGFVVLPGNGSFVFCWGISLMDQKRSLSVCNWRLLLADKRPMSAYFPGKTGLVKIPFILRCCYGGYCKHSNSICEPSLETPLFPAACLCWLEETATKPTGCPTVCLFCRLGLTFTKKILPVWTHGVILIFNVT